MTDNNHKNYTLTQVENFLHDALQEASPQEIYDVIKKVVEENYYHHKHHASQCYEFLALLNGNGKGHITGYEPKEPLVCDKDNQSPECQASWNSFWEQHYTEEEINAMCDKAELEERQKKKTWVLPVEVDGPSGEYYIILPDELMETAGIYENDVLEWIDNLDGTYLLKKVQN